MSIVTSVHLKVVRCHRFKKKHHMRLLLKVFADLEKLFSLKWRCPPREAFHWWRGEYSADPAGRPIMKCSVGVSLVLKNPGRAPKMKGCCWITQRRWDSWPPEEKNSIRGQRRGLIAQSFCVINFYESIKEIEKADIDIRRGQERVHLASFFTLVTHGLQVLISFSYPLPGTLFCHMTKFTLGFCSDVIF